MVIALALTLLAEQGRKLTVTAEPDEQEPLVDHLADIAHVIDGERRVRTHTVLTRLATHNPGEYDGWVFADLSTTKNNTAQPQPDNAKGDYDTKNDNALDGQWGSPGVTPGCRSSLSQDQKNLSGSRGFIDVARVDVVTLRNFYGTRRTADDRRVTTTELDRPHKTS